MSSDNAERRATRWLNWLQRLSPEAAEVQQQWRREGARESLAPAWFLVEIPDGESPTLHEFNTAEEVAARIRTIDDSETIVFAFCGYQAAISQPPYRYLMLPGGLNLPAFVTPDESPIEVDPSGYLGSDLAEPAEISVRRPDEPAASRFRANKKHKPRSEYEYDEHEPV